MASGGGGDPYFANVSLLIQPTAASASILDLSRNGHTVTAVGDAALSTAVSDPWGGSRKVIVFDGAGDWLTLPGGTTFAFGTGDLTVEYFAYAASANDGSIIDFRASGGFSDVSPNVYVNSANVPILYTAGADRITGTAAATGAFVHVALTRESGTSRLWKAGAQVGSDYTDGNNYVVGASRPIIAGNGANTAIFEWAGYMTGIRVTKGVARYSSTFSVPTDPFPDI